MVDTQTVPTPANPRKPRSSEVRPGGVPVQGGGYLEGRPILVNRTFQSFLRKLRKPEIQRKNHRGGSGWYSPERRGKSVEGPELSHELVTWQAVFTAGVEIHRNPAPSLAFRS